MSQATRRNSNKRRSSHFALPPWLWALIGILLVFFIARQLTQQASAPLEVAKKTLETTSPTHLASNNLNEFDFYTLLSKTEGIVNAQPINGFAKKAQPTNSHKLLISPPILVSTPSKVEKPLSSDRTLAVKTPRYLLQIASSRSERDANKLAQTLRELGLVIQVNSAIGQDGNLWYRIQTGPYTMGNELDRARHLIESRQLEPLLLKVF